MDRKLPPNLIKWLGAITLFGTLAAVIAVISFGVELSAHGWGAMLAGTLLSFLLGSVLTAVLVFGRRHGYDEAADIRWDMGQDD